MVVVMLTGNKHCVLFAGLGKALGIAGGILGVVSPLCGILIWLLLFNSYRAEKNMLIKQVMVHIRAHHMCRTASDALATTSNPMLLRSADSLSGSGALDAPMITAPMSSVILNTYDLADDNPDVTPELAEDMRKAGKEIAVRCLQRWDGVLGLRASRDSLGNKSGIWRDRFESVRFASLLLAFRKYNEVLAPSRTGNTGNAA